MTLTLANHRYKPHTTCIGALIALKKTNLSSGWPGIEKSEVCVCGTRRSRFRKRGARHDQTRVKLMSNAFPSLCGGASAAHFFSPIKFAILRAAFIVLGKERINRTLMTLIERIIADKTKKVQRQSALSASSAFY
jgi:hypothetical protein